MPFLDNTSMLLTSDQLTFVGVIATLAVLSVTSSGQPQQSRRRRLRQSRRNSLFSGSNLLVDLIREFKISVEDFLNNAGIKKNEDDIGKIKTKIQGLQQNLQIANPENRESLSKDPKKWEKEIEIKASYDMDIKGLLDSLEIEKTVRIDKVKEDLKALQQPTYIEQYTPVFMSFFTFIFSVAIMSIHFLHFNEFINASLLFLFDAFFMIGLLSSWMLYRHDWLSREKKNNLLENDSWSSRKNYLPAVFVACLVVILITKNVIVTIVCVVIPVSKLSFAYMRNKYQSEHYNVGNLALFAVVGMFLATVVSFVLHFFATATLLLYVFVEAHIAYWRTIFVLLCVVNTFILPLLLSYYRYEVKITWQLKAIVRLYRNGYRKAKRASRKIEKEMATTR